MPAAETFLRDGRMPSAQGLAWAAAGGTATPADLPRLPVCIRAMVAAG